MTRIDNGIGGRVYCHRGVHIEQRGLSYVAWTNYVTQSWCQDRHDTLAQARDAVNAAVRS